MPYWSASRLASAASSNPTLFVSAQRLASICPVPSSIVYCTCVDFSCVALIRPRMQIYIRLYPLSFLNAWQEEANTRTVPNGRPSSSHGESAMISRASRTCLIVQCLRDCSLFFYSFHEPLEHPEIHLLNTATTQNAPWPWEIQKVLVTHLSHSGTRSCCHLP